MLAEPAWITSVVLQFINHFRYLPTSAYLRTFTECISLTTWEQFAGTIVRWYVLAIVVYAVFWVVWVLSGSNAYNMVTNMIIGVSGLIVIIIMFEVLKRRIKS